MVGLMALPVTVKILLVLLSFLLIHRLTGSLAGGLVLGTGILVLWLPLEPGTALALAGGKLTSRDNLALLAVVFGVIFLSRLMEASGGMTRLVQALESRFPPRAAVASLPAAIGLLPMPGGAVFSAPLIDAYDRENQLSGDLKTRINFWFRHVWEYWWPLYPGVILAVDLSGIPLPEFSGLMAPMSAAAGAAGFLFFLRRVKPQGEGSGRLHGGGPRISAALAPILLVAGIFGTGRLLFPGTGAYVPLLAGLAASVLMIQIRNPLGGKALLSLAFTRKALDMMVIVAAVQVYGAFLEASPGGGLPVTALMRGELAAAGIPPLALAVLLPFLTGLATGISVGFVGASFPIVLSLLPAGAGEAGFTAGVMAAYMAGFAGVMLSPVHVCLVVTNNHFGTRLGKSLAGIGPAMALTLGAGWLSLSVRQGIA